MFDEAEPVIGFGFFLVYVWERDVSASSTGTRTAQVRGLSIQIWALGICANSRFARHLGRSLRAMTRN